MRFFRYFGYAADLAVSEPYFNAPRMESRGGQNILYRAVGDLSVPLILLKDDTHFQSRVDVFPVLSFHYWFCCGDKDNARPLSSKAIGFILNNNPALFLFILSKAKT